MGIREGEESKEGRGWKQDGDVSKPRDRRERFKKWKRGA